VKLVVKEEPADTYYADLAGLPKHPFQVFYYSNRPAAVHLAATTTAAAPFNVTGTGPDYWKKLAAAQVSVDDARRAAAFAELELEAYNTGGDLVWGLQETLDICRSGLTGLRMNHSVPQFNQAALAA
jgi:peptide/nickel transport system substrate-binding protein